MNAVLRFARRLWASLDLGTSGLRSPLEVGRGIRDLPATYLADPGDPRVQHARVFEPALIHYAKAYRKGEPVFADPVLAAEWRRARREAIEHLVRTAIASPWGDRLVLRGSLVLGAWLGDAAREPGDIDWVVQPHTLGLRDPLGQRLVGGLRDCFGAVPRTVSGVVIDVDAIVTDDIWTYDRAPGRRIVLPFRAGDLPVGTVQVDLVFGEELGTPPVETALPTSDGSTLLVSTVDAALSLAWKVLWLVSDVHPQGKDLYDAVLLAEHAPLPGALLRAILEDADVHPTWSRTWPKKLANLSHIAVDWDNFRLEYPWVSGEARQWTDRLAHALAPTVTSIGPVRAYLDVAR